MATRNCVCDLITGELGCLRVGCHRGSFGVSACRVRPACSWLSILHHSKRSRVTPSSTTSLLCTLSSTSPPRSPSDSSPTAQKCPPSASLRRSASPLARPRSPVSPAAVTPTLPTTSSSSRLFPPRRFVSTRAGQRNAMHERKNGSVEALEGQNERRKRCGESGSAAGVGFAMRLRLRTGNWRRRGGIDIDTIAIARRSQSRLLQSSVCLLLLERDHPDEIVVDFMSTFRDCLQRAPDFAPPRPILAAAERPAPTLYASCIAFIWLASTSLCNVLTSGYLLVAGCHPGEHPRRYW